jgi:hypothetical protein
MARPVSREFDVAKPTVVRRKFIAGGRHYVAGDVFDWRRLSLTARKAKQMFDSGHIGHESVAIAKPAPISIVSEVSEHIDELDAIEDMKELRAIADAEGAGYKVSKADQRQAIRDNRKESN